jgi:hypothetical protein
MATIIPLRLAKIKSKMKRGMAGGLSTRLFHNARIQVIFFGGGVILNESTR